MEEAGFPLDLFLFGVGYNISDPPLTGWVRKSGRFRRNEYVAEAKPKEVFARFLAKSSVEQNSQLGVAFRCSILGCDKQTRFEGGEDNGSNESSHKGGVNPKNETAR